MWPRMILKKETLMKEWGTQKSWRNNNKDITSKEEDNDL